MGMQWYGKRFRKLLKRFRESAPKAGCLVMSPVDHGERNPYGGIRTQPLLLKMVPVQRKIAFEEGCAFFSTFDAMGGQGSAGRWRKMKPSRMEGDYAHLTRAGNKVLGTLFYQAILVGLHDYIEGL